MKDQEAKVGVYICYCGGNISDHVDVEKVRERAEKIPGVAVARTNMFMCSDPGQELIAEDIKKGLINKVVVASCAPSLHEMTFRGTISRAGSNPYLYEHANIREQVSWVHHGEPATEKAFKLVAAAVGKAKFLDPLDPIRVDARQHATVIGGGIAGLRAAKDLAERGFHVALIEKSPFLGGWTAMLEKVAPTGNNASDLLTELATQVLDDSSITIHTCAQVTGFEGYVGNFDLKVKTAPPQSRDDQEKLKQLAQSGRSKGEFIPFVGIYPKDIPEKEQEFTVHTGVVVLATGFRPYSPKKGEYGYQELEQVITLPELIQKMARANSTPDGYLEIDGRKIRNISMIHCVGSRQIPGIHEPDELGNLNEYCSRTCCSSTLFNANLIRTKFPKTRVYDFYRDIRTYGRGQEELYNEAAKNKVVFMRFEPDAPPVVARAQDSSEFPLMVTVKDTLTFGEEIQVPSDLVVLAVGMVPNAIPELVEMMKLPVGADQFLLEVHPKLRPVEISVSGILLAGTCQAPMDIGEACNAAGAAAVKASAILAKGYVELDPFVAEVNHEKCKGTGACVQACLSEGALKMVEVQVDGKTVQRAEVFPALCWGCGACVAVCPENAIDIKGWTLRQYEEMVDMIVADELAA